MTTGAIALTEEDGFPGVNSFARVLSCSKNCSASCEDGDEKDSASHFRSSVIQESLENLGQLADPSGELFPVGTIRENETSGGSHDSNDSQSNNVCSNKPAAGIRRHGASAAGWCARWCSRRRAGR